MASLLEAVEHEVDTDFELLGATQDGGTLERPMSWNFAVTAPGVVSLVAGFRYARASIRLERWDGAPPEEHEGWHDRDEVPFEALDDLGPLRPHGFDPPDGPGLDVEGLGRSRVRILARGRHQYWRGEPVAGKWVPEQYVLRLWPDPDRRDAMAGESRRLAGPQPFSVRCSAWHETIRTWERTGWRSFLDAIPGFGRIHKALSMSNGPCRVDDLRVPVSNEPGTLPTWQPITPDMPLRVVEPDESRWDKAASRLAQLNDELRMSIETCGDLLSALTRLGLLARLEDGSQRFTAVPKTTPVWDLFDVTDEQVRRMKSLSDLEFFRTIADDLLHLILWAPDRMLRATPVQIAMRLALHVEDVLGGLRLLATPFGPASHGPLRVSENLEQAAMHDTVELQLIGAPPRRMRWPT